eukprot:359699-Amphidinium_carterae.1
MGCGLYELAQGKCSDSQIQVKRRLLGLCKRRFVSCQNFVEPASDFSSLRALFRGRGDYELSPSQGVVAKMELERLSLPGSVERASLLSDILEGKPLERLH